MKRQLMLKRSSGLIAAAALMMGGLAHAGPPGGSGPGTPPPPIQTNSYPGAVKSNGNFFVIKTNGTSQQICEWLNTPTGGSWGRYQTYFGYNLYGEQPRGLTPTGGFNFLVKSGGNPYPLRWEPPGTLSSFGNPPGAPSGVSASSAVMYGNRVMYVAGGKLHERFLFGSTTWFTHGYAGGIKPLRDVPPCVLSDGSVFVTTTGGEVYQMWWTGSAWHWYNHGYPKKPSIFGTGGVKALSLGAAMPGSSKIFVTCDDGSLRQISYSGGSWGWFNHGLPFGWRVSSPATAVSDGKLFVTANSGTTNQLCQLYWSGSSWVWYSHYTPPGPSGAASLTGPPVSWYGADRVVVRGTNGNHYMLYWTGSTWGWKACGAP